MPSNRLRGALEHVRLTLAPPGGGLTDAQLLTRFVAERDEGAFASLVDRHGPLVLGVCRRVLRDHHDAEDAFQATFLALARKAPSLRRRAAVGSWLYEVAYHTAVEAGRARGRRGRERQVGDMPHPEVQPTEPQDWRPVLDRELAALPEKYRSAIVLCDLEGHSRREAARQLGLPEGTLSSRLATGRRVLAGRLTRRGVAFSGGALAAALSGGAASARVPEALVWSTAQRVHESPGDVHPHHPVPVRADADLPGRTQLTQAPPRPGGRARESLQEDPMLLRRPAPGRRGAALLEMALIESPFLMLLFGLIVVGLGVSRYQRVAALAREGARYASVRGGQYQQNTGNAAATQQSVDSYVRSLAVGLDSSQLTTSVAWGNPSANPGKMPIYLSDPTNNVWTRETVTVTVRYTWFPEMHWAGPITLTSTSTLPITN
jgi:RNA polymerase sigma factor (sigma-70 family)